MGALPVFADPSAEFRKLPREIRQRIRRVSPRASACWLWLGPLSYQGRPCSHMSLAECICYGRQSWPIVPDNPGTSPTNWLAHRLTFTCLIGEIPDDLPVLDHLKDRCTTRRCVRPDHLEPVTLEENTRRGGGRFGSKKLVVPERKRVVRLALDLVDEEVQF